MTKAARSAVVVGAGLAGMTAALRLQKAGFDVKVLERGDRPGGRVKTLRRDGFVIDAGPDAMTSGYRAYLALVEELGLTAQVVPSSPVVGLVRHGKVVDIDLTHMLSALFTSALSWLAKLNMAIGMFRIRKMLRGVDSFNLVNSAELDDDTESAQQYGERYFGKEATDYVVDPLMRLTAASRAMHCSRLGVLGGLVNWSAQLVNIKGGLDVVTDAMAKRLDIACNAEVDHVHETKSGMVEVSYRDPQGQGQSLQADVAVLATTYDIVEKLYPRVLEFAGGYGETLGLVGLVSISVAYTAETRSKAYALQVPTVENAEVLLMFLQHNKAPDRVPPGCSMVTIYTDALVTSRMLKEPDDTLTRWGRGEIERLFPELRGHFKFAEISRWPVAGYQASPGFWRRTRDFQAALPDAAPVQISGDLFGAGSMEAAVLGGIRAADLLVRHHGGSNQPADD